MTDEPKEDDATTPYRKPDHGPIPSPMRNAMFGNYTAAKNRKMPVWAGFLLIGVVVFHMGLFSWMWISSIWSIDMLDKPKNTIDLAIAPPPPPPPPPPPGGA